MRNAYLIVETIFIFVFNCVLGCWASNLDKHPVSFWFIYIPFLLFQGLWFYRFYIVGHEASHRKLFPQNYKVNDFFGGLILLPIMVPITIYRKIHLFHHGYNRKDDHTSALDTFVIRGKFIRLKKLYCYFVWYISVFMGGFFIHSLISVLLFLFVPPSISIKVSPAFQNWTWKDQFKSIFLFLLGVGFHISFYLVFGKKYYLYALGFPMLSFAWVLSLLVYIFHYDTTKGDHVRYNVRSVNWIPVFSWILMNFNEHATHHQHPNIPWYEIPGKRSALPEKFHEKNQSTWNFFRAIVNQLKGPVIVYEK